MWSWAWADPSRPTPSTRAATSILTAKWGQIRPPPPSHGFWTWVFLTLSPSFILQRKSYLCFSFLGIARPSATISTFMCIWAIYIFPGSVYIFPPAEYADRSWEYINRSQTHECGNWDWDPDIPFLVSKLRYFVFAVWMFKPQGWKTERGGAPKCILPPSTSMT